ncbi:MAG: thioesterase family protein [Hydrogenophilaceae bacterium]
MKDSLQPGISNVLSFTLPEQKMVPGLYPEAPEFQTMPPVFATGYLVGFLEWACLQSVIPHLDWPREQTVGTHVNVSHEAATPVGMTVTARTRLVEVDGRRLVFEVEADDGVDLISRGTHERYVIDTERFNAKVARKKEPK